MALRAVCSPCHLPPCRASSLCALYSRAPDNCGGLAPLDNRVETSARNAHAQRLSPGGNECLRHTRLRACATVSHRSLARSLACLLLLTFAYNKQPTRAIRSAARQATTSQARTNKQAQRGKEIKNQALGRHPRILLRHSSCCPSLIKLNIYIDQSRKSHQRRQTRREE